MNYLAHLLLAEQTPQGWLGALMGDFVKGAIDPTLPGGIRRGIVLHRRIDSFTDAHPVHRASRNRIAGARRRYAGIIIDLCYDHFLARSWAHHAALPLDEFTIEVYAVLARHRTLLPPRLERIAPRHDRPGLAGLLPQARRAGRRARRYRDPLAPRRAPCRRSGRRAALPPRAWRGLRRLLPGSRQVRERREGEGASLRRESLRHRGEPEYSTDSRPLRAPGCRDGGTHGLKDARGVADTKSLRLEGGKLATASLLAFKEEIGEISG